MTAKSVEKEIYAQLYDALEMIEKLKQQIKKMEMEHKAEIQSLKKEITHLKQDIKDKDKQLEEKDKIIEKLKGDILHLKNNNKKDSSNSSKPSGTNGYKKVITNRREKSDKKPGKPKGESSTNLSEEKYQKFINSGDVEIKVINCNLTKRNKYQKYIRVRELDVKIVKQVTEYRYYPDKNGKYHVPKHHKHAIVYGPTLKSLCSTLNNAIYNSTDGIVSFISSITNKGITLSKSSILRWNKELSTKLKPEIEKIEEGLVQSYYLNADDSSFKINGNGYNDLCVCNDKYTRLWVSESKSHDAWKENTLLSSYQGVIVKDGTDVFNGFGIFLSQCISHILRYIKGIYDFVNHSSSKRMAEFLQLCIHKRKCKIADNFKEFSQNELDEFEAEYTSIFKSWKREWMQSSPSTNPVYDDERKLLARFEDDEEKKQILYFLRDFNVPTTNNQAEVDQRHLKVKQKIGKFRSIEGAYDYAIIRSCINTYKKNDIDVFKAIKSAFENNIVLI